MSTPVYWIRGLEVFVKKGVVGCSEQDSLGDEVKKMEAVDSFWNSRDQSHFWPPLGHFQG